MRQVRNRTFSRLQHISVKNIMKNVSLKTSNKRTFSLSLFESESHYTVIVTHFFRLLKLFEIFKGKYCVMLKFYFCIRYDSYLLISEFYIGLMLQCNIFSILSAQLFVFRTFSHNLELFAQFRQKMCSL